MTMASLVPRRFRSWIAAGLLAGLAMLPAPASAAVDAGAAGSPSDGITVGRFGNELVVTAPTGAGLDGLGARNEILVSLDIVDAGVPTIADRIHQLTGLTTVCMADLMADPGSVTLKVRGITMGNLLHWITVLSHVSICYREGALCFSRAPLSQLSSTRIYDVSDLCLPLRDLPGPELSIPAPGGTRPRLFPSLAPAPPAPSARDIADLIRRVVAPGR